MRIRFNYVVKNIYGDWPIERNRYIHTDLCFNNSGQRFLHQDVQRSWPCYCANPAHSCSCNKRAGSASTIWFVLRNLFFALALGLALVAGPEAVGITGLLAATVTSGRALLKGLQQTLMMGRGIWPAGTESSEPIQFGDVDAELNNATSQLSKSSMQALKCS